MRKTAAAVTTALVLALAPTAVAAEQTAAEPAAQATSVSEVVAQDENNDDGSSGGHGLWGLLGLLGLLGLMPKKNKHRDVDTGHRAGAGAGTRGGGL